MGSNEEICSIEKALKEKNEKIEVLESQLEIFGNHN